jgi:serine/threonine protein kinase
MQVFSGFKNIQTISQSQDRIVKQVRTACGRRKLLIMEYENADEHFMQEVEALIALKRPNVVKLVGFSLPTYVEPARIAIKFVSEQTLESIINCPDWLIQTLIGRMVVELVSAISFMHSFGIVHRNLEPGNIFIDSEHHIKIGNFSFY